MLVENEVLSYILTKEIIGLAQAISGREYQMPQHVNNRLIRLQKEHKALDAEIKRLYNTTNSERTIKEMKVQKLRLKDQIQKLKGENNGKEN